MDKHILMNTGVSISKSALGAVPFVGTMLNDVFFDFRGRLKQQRINIFIDELQQYMISHVREHDINMEYVSSEQFGDLFESIITRVSQNNQKEKIDRFKLILVNQMIAPHETDYTETFCFKNQREAN